MLTSRDVFLLDPDYQNFEPGKSALKLKTLAGMTAGEIFIGLGFCLMIVGVLLTIFIYTEQRHERFRREGVETTFRITACQTIRNSSKSGTSYSANITFSYQVNGELYSDTARLSGKCDRYPIEQQLTGVYLAGQPYETLVISMAQLERPFYTRQNGFWWGCLFGAGAAAGALYFIRKYVVARNKIQRLTENGRLLNGRILQARSELRNKSRHHYVVIQYVFASPEGNRLTGRQDNHREDLRPPTPPGWFSRWFSGDREKRKQEDIPRLPASGTPVLVLYADDRTYLLL